MLFRSFCRFPEDFRGESVLRAADSSEKRKRQSFSTRPFPFSIGRRSFFLRVGLSSPAACAGVFMSMAEGTCGHEPIFQATFDDAVRRSILAIPCPISFCDIASATFRVISSFAIISSPRRIRRGNQAAIRHRKAGQAARARSRALVVGHEIGRAHV